METYRDEKEEVVDKTPAWKKNLKARCKENKFTIKIMGWIFFYFSIFVTDTAIMRFIFPKYSVGIMILTALIVSVGYLAYSGIVYTAIYMTSDPAISTESAAYSLRLFKISKKFHSISFLAPCEKEAIELGYYNK